MTKKFIWSKFTSTYLNLFSKNKVNIDNNNPLLCFIKNERSKIKQFIKNNYSLKNLINIKKISDLLFIEKLNIKIIKFSNVTWVDEKSVLLQLNQLDQIYQITWNNNIIYIKMFKHCINSVLKNINLIIYIIEYLKSKSNTHENKNIEIYLILTDLKKFFPIKNQIINVQNVNTGYTDFNENIIFIWRYEEYIKVIFHEIIHFLHLDHSNIHIHSVINSKGSHSYFEAITDFYAIIYNIIYISLITKIQIKILL